VGGWSGLTSALGSRPFEDWSGLAQSGSHSWNTALVGLGAGIVLGVCFWCVDFRALQPALAAQSRESAGRTPLVAAIPWLLVALLAVGSGALAIALPTPHTSVVQQEVEGTIVRTTTVVRPEEEAGHGLVSAQVDGGGTRRNAAGQPLLDYNMATPRLMRQTLANGLLGLGITLLLTCLMSGLSANLTAFNTVVATDLYEPFFTKAATDKSCLAAARFVAGGGMMLFVAAACVVNRSHCSGLLLLLPRALVVVNAPLLAVLFLGLRRKRAQGAGAGRVAALVGGMVTAVLHLGLTLPAGEAKGSIVPLFHYPSEAAQLVATALLAMVCSGLVVGVNGLLRATPLDEKS